MNEIDKFYKVLRYFVVAFGVCFILLFIFGIISYICGIMKLY